ncbi:TRAP transporter small permease [Xanthobacteraceae bacterium Astr-EGSB]|uniref:TRAP transporter small permease n=1 Tax=Astrobacterium formosum TaxID=3069710 RepID=UPI0027B5B013|nr:TRAP transporter small permease [Xanthobacteraceae bacterium Astr-EGSB]
MTRLVQAICRAIEIAVTLLLVAMSAMVFGNVVLRYGFNLGIDVSDELSRYAFVWLTFLGAILTLGDNSHVNIETVVAWLPRHGRRVCMGATQIIIMLCAVAMFLGTEKLRPFNATLNSSVTEIPMSWVSNAGFVAATGFFLIALVRLVRVVSGRVSDAELAAFAGEHAEEKTQ